MWSSTEIKTTKASYQFGCIGCIEKQCLLQGIYTSKCIRVPKTTHESVRMGIFFYNQTMVTRSKLDNNYIIPESRAYMNVFLFEFGSILTIRAFY